MAPQHATRLPLHDVAGSTIEGVEKEGPDPHRSHEADAVGVGLVLDAQTALRAGGAHLGLARIVSHGKERAVEGRPGHPPEEVGLVLVLVGGAQERGRSALGRGMSHTGVVTGRHVVRPEREGPLGEGAELDGLVAHDVGIGRVASGVGVDEVVHHRVVVLPLAVPDLERNAQRHAHALGVGEVVRPGALEARQVARPVSHVDRVHVIALLDEQGRGEGGVDSARESHEDLLAHQTRSAMRRFESAAMSASVRPRRSISPRTAETISRTA